MIATSILPFLYYFEEELFFPPVLPLPDLEEELLLPLFRPEVDELLLEVVLRLLLFPPLLPPERLLLLLLLLPERLPEERPLPLPPLLLPERLPVLEERLPDPPEADPLFPVPWLRLRPSPERPDERLSS